MMLVTRNCKHLRNFLLKRDFSIKNKINYKANKIQINIKKSNKITVQSC